ncbi:MAG: hypothetical protein AAFR44_12675, partial [Pseudomonadota bacterium]
MNKRLRPLARQRLQRVDCFGHRHQIGGALDTKILTARQFGDGVQRLGIDGSMLAELLERAGLQVRETRTLAPPSTSGPEALTVTLW